MEEFKDTGLLTLFFFSCYLSKMRVLYVALQFTLACTTEMFTIFLSFYKQLPKMQFCAQWVAEHWTFNKKKLPLSKY